MVTLKMIATDNPHKVYVLKYYHSARTYYINQLVLGVLYYKRWEKVPAGHVEMYTHDIWGKEVEAVTYRTNEVKLSKRI